MEDNLSALLESEALRVLRRYVDEVVLPLGLCPWAEPSLRAGRVAFRAALMPQELNQRSKDAQVAWAAETAEALFQEGLGAPERELVLVSFPQLFLDRHEYERVPRLLREKWGDSPPALLAAFHPDAQPDLKTPARLIPFLRRTPDPTLQAARTEVMQKIDPNRGAGTRFVSPEGLLALLSGERPRETLRDRIYRENRDAVLKEGVAEVQALLDRILEDRNQSLGRFGIPPRELGRRLTGDSA